MAIAARSKACRPSTCCIAVCHAVLMRVVCPRKGVLLTLQVPEKEYEETVNKAAALGRAIDLAEQAFL